MAGATLIFALAPNGNSKETDSAPLDVSPEFVKATVGDRRYNRRFWRQDQSRGIDWSQRIAERQRCSLEVRSPANTFPSAVVISYALLNRTSRNEQPSSEPQASCPTFLNRSGKLTQRQSCVNSDQASVAKKLTWIRLLMSTRDTSEFLTFLSNLESSDTTRN
jgi:hypothetical protein